MTLLGNINSKRKLPKQKVGKFEEIGVIGVNSFANIINQAYISRLRWPAVQPIYSKMWRSNPEVTIARNIMTALASSVDIKPVLPENPTDDDKKAAEFIETDFENTEGGIQKWRDKLVSTLPFYGWGWWEIVPGLRKEGWRPPDKNDPWKSAFNDGLIGARNLAWRDYSTFSRWIIDDKGRTLGMVQLTQEGREKIMLSDRAIHMRFGDLENPEGLATMEAHYRLERIKYGLEMVFGIGSEHAAGHLNVTLEAGMSLSDKDVAAIKKAARAILTAQEGNYATWPNGMKGEVIDVPFGAGQTILDGLRYYGLLALQLYNMQWVAMSTITGTGSFAAMQDSSQMSVTTFNAMMETFIDQLNNQYIDWLFRVNAGSFPNLSTKPKVVATKVRKNVDLDQLTSFLEWYAGNYDVSEGDLLNIRSQTEILKEELPMGDEVVESIAPEETAPKDTEEEDETEDEDRDEDDSDLSLIRGAVERAVKKSPNFIQRLFNLQVK